MRSELFEETLKQHKDSLTDELEQLGKHRQAQLAVWDIEQNESDYEFYFNAGWNAQQSKVDELTLQVAEMKSRLNDAYTDGQSAMYTARQSKIDELQKRVDAAKYYMKNIFSVDAEVDQCHLGDMLDILDGKIVDELEQALKGD